MSEDKNIFTGDTIEYYQICKIIDSKLTKEESDRIKNYIEGLSSNLQSVKYPLQSLYDKVLEIKNIIDSKVKK